MELHKIYTSQDGLSGNCDGHMKHFYVEVKHRYKSGSEDNLYFDISRTHVMTF